MRRLVKIQNEGGLVRDENTKAILSSDARALQGYKLNRDAKLTAAKTQQSIVARQEVIEKDLGEIKELLKALLVKPQ